MNLLEKSELIKTNEITASENLEQYIQEIEKKNSSLNVYLETDFDKARETAENIDSRIKKGEKVGRLAGLVIGVKSNINVEDFHITAASKTLENYLGSYNATVINRIQDEGGVIVGMTNMDEFAAGSSTETSYFGHTQNPAAEGRIPGGSSGGSAAAIAAGLCDLSIGSDTGGSIRNPASHCGVMGFKPTYGVVSRQGLLDLAMSLDQIGPFAGDASGIAMMLDTIAGFDERECSTIDWNVPDFTELTGEGAQDSLKGMKLGVVKQFLEVSDDSIVDIIQGSIDKWRRPGLKWWN